MKGLAWRLGALRRLHGRALILRQVGGVENFDICKREVEGWSGGVVCKIDACSIAFRDTLDRRGAFPFIKNNSILGHEIAATVLEPSDDFDKGDRVVSVHWDQDEAWPSPLTSEGPVKSFLGLTTDGGYQEFACLPRGALVKLPESVVERWNAIEASAVMSTFGTVFMGAVERGRLQKGDSVVITGASGGVGSAAVQLCKAIGCKVFAVSSSKGKRAFLESLGADMAICGEEKFNKIIENETNGRGVDLAIECTGAPTFQTALRSLRPEGVLVLVGNTTNAVAEMPVGYVILKSLRVIGSDSITREALLDLFQLLTEKNMRPRIDSVISLTDIPEAHRRLEAKQVSGRIVAKFEGSEW